MWHSVADADAAADSEALEDPAGGARGARGGRVGRGRLLRGFARGPRVPARGAHRAGRVRGGVSRDQARGRRPRRRRVARDQGAGSDGDARGAPRGRRRVGSGAERAARVASEVDILSRLDHPNVVKYHESFRDGNAVYIVMDLVEGASLLEHIRSVEARGRRVAESFAWDCFSQLALALRYIHEDKGVVHRDLTPGNVLLERDARDPTSENQIRVKLADFGLAKASRPRTAPVRENRQTGGETKSNSNAHLTNASTRFDAVMQSAVGTMPYSCPEIIKHEPYDHKADVWSLGCVLYHLLALRPPFDGSNPLTCASAVVEGRVARRSTRRRASDTPTRSARSSRDCSPPSPPRGRPSPTSCPRARRRSRARWTARARTSTGSTRRSRGSARSAADAATARRKRDALIARSDRRSRGAPVEEVQGSPRRHMGAATTSRAAEEARGMPPGRDPDRCERRSRSRSRRRVPARGGFGGFSRRRRPRGVRIGAARLRPVADPTSRILATLHKLVYLDQLRRRRGGRTRGSPRFGGSSGGCSEGGDQVRGRSRAGGEARGGDERGDGGGAGGGEGGGGGGVRDLRGARESRRGARRRAGILRFPKGRVEVGGGFARGRNEGGRARGARAGSGARDETPSGMNRRHLTSSSSL